MFRRDSILLGLLIGFAIGATLPQTAWADAKTLGRENPWDVGLNWKTVAGAYETIRTAIREDAGPGAVALIAKDGVVIRRAAFGQAQLYGGRTVDEEGKVIYTPLQRRMTVDTIFDLASLTKMVATNTSIQILIEEGKIHLDTPVAHYLPEFGAEGKEEVTVRHLLTHTSGLTAWVSLYKRGKGRKSFWREICASELDSPPGYQRVYSDLGFITLGVLVEEVSGQRLDRFTSQRIFKPLGMVDTGFNPSRRERKRCAATEWSELQGHFLCGEVHDENAFAFGGDSGHAGLFSTANDLAIFCQMLLNEGAYGDARILSADSISRMLTPQLPQEVLNRGSAFLRVREQLLGWWSMGERMEISTTGGLPSPEAFGHTGFTGTSIWVDPQHETFAILLTNAVHPTRQEAERAKFRKGFHQAIWDALLEAGG